MKKRLYISDDEAEFFTSNKMICSDVPPTQGDFIVGDIVVSNKQEDDVFGWVCIEAGSPGLWKQIINSVDIKAIVEELEEHNKMIDFNINVLKNRIDGLEEQIIENKNEYNNKIDELNNKITNNIIDNENLNKNIEEILHNDSITEGEINLSLSVMNANIQKNTNDITLISNKLNNNNSEIEDIKQDILSNSNNNEVVKNEIDDLKNAIVEVLIGQGEDVDNQTSWKDLFEFLCKNSCTCDKDPEPEVPEIIPCTSITLNSTLVTLDVDETFILNATVLPVDTTDKITWSNNDNEVVLMTISEDGNSVTLLAKKPGNTIITAYCGDMSVDCTIVVNSVEIEEPDEPLVCTSLTCYEEITVDTSDELGVWTGLEAVPTECLMDVVYICEPAGIINIYHAIDGTGTCYVEPLAVGNAVVTFTYGDKSCVCNVTVTDKSVISCIGIDIKDTEMKVIQYESESHFYPLNYTVTPTDTTDRVVWTIEQIDPSVVIEGKGITISSDTLIIPAISESKVTDVLIMATCGSYTDSCRVIVNRNCRSIQLNKTSKSIDEGSSFTLTATVSPSDCPDTITWSSSNSSIASVSSSGKVTGKSAGYCTITAKCGNETATCNVTVNALYVPCTGISCNSSVTVAVGSTKSLGISVSPSNCTNTIYLTSSNESIATTSRSSYVYGESPGSCTVTVKCGDYSDTCSVTVYDPYVCSDIEIVTPNPYNTRVGNQATILARPVPSTTTDTLSFSVGDTSILTGTQVDQEFRMRELKAGTTTVTIRCGSITKTVTVIVSE